MSQKDWGRQSLRICISNKFLGVAVVTGPGATLRTTTVKQGTCPIWQVTQTNGGHSLRQHSLLSEKPSKNKNVQYRRSGIYSPEEDQDEVV